MICFRGTVTHAANPIPPQEARASRDFQEGHRVLFWALTLCQQSIDPATFFNFPEFFVHPYFGVPDTFLQAFSSPLGERRNTYKWIPK